MLFAKLWPFSPGGEELTVCAYSPVPLAARTAASTVITKFGSWFYVAVEEWRRFNTGCCFVAVRRCSAAWSRWSILHRTLFWCGVPLPHKAVNWIQLISKGIFTLVGSSLAPGGEMGPWANLRLCMVAQGNATVQQNSTLCKSVLKILDPPIWKKWIWILPEARHLAQWLQQTMAATNLCIWGSVESTWYIIYSSYICENCLVMWLPMSKFIF